jgi:glucose/arabinose dehydrogenase
MTTIAQIHWTKQSNSSAVIMKRMARNAPQMMFTMTVLMLLLIQAPAVTALPVGFVDEGVLSRDAIITGAFAPNPRNGNKPMLLLSTKEAQIYAVEDPDHSEDNVVVADLKALLCTNGERGLQSIVPHPNFKENQFIYLFYSKAVQDCPESAVTGPPNRVSRFVMDPETLAIDVSTELVIMQTSPSPKKMHNGGSMSFGVDGYLYITTGDGGQRDPSYAQDLSNLYGSVLRVDENGDAPASNPFTAASGGTGVPCGKNGSGRPASGSSGDAVCEEIFAYGLRNPFRLTMDYDSVDRVLFYIGDVGASVWEEIS